MNGKHRVAIVVALLMVAAALAGCGETRIVTASADTAKLNTVTTSGEGKAVVAPDQAELDFGASAEGSNAKQVFADASAKAQKIIDALKAAGIGTADMQTSGVELNPQWEYRANGDMVAKGYAASIGVHVTVKDISTTGDVITAAVDAGAKNVTGPTFSLSETSASRVQAVETAVADARARAEAMAKAAGKTLGQVLTISEAPVTTSPVYYDRSFAASAAATGGAPTVPVEAGTVHVSASVTVVFEMK